MVLFPLLKRGLVRLVPVRRQSPERAAYGIDLLWNKAQYVVMRDDRDNSVTLICAVCGADYHPIRRRAATSVVCSKACNGVYQSSQRNQKDELTEFMARVRKTETCWIWTGVSLSSGYGVFSCNAMKTTAHRASMRLLNGLDPTGLFVCHTCDNPICVNPAHLFLGSAKDNVDDMHSKGRAVTPRLLDGESHPLHKLTRDQAISIRASGESVGVLSERFGVSKSLVRGIKAGTHWKHA